MQSASPTFAHSACITAMIHCLVCATLPRYLLNVTHREMVKFNFRGIGKWKAIYLPVISCVKTVKNLL